MTPCAWLRRLLHHAPTEPKQEQAVANGPTRALDLVIPAQGKPIIVASGRVVTIAGTAPPQMVVGQPWSWSYSASANDNTTVIGAIDPVGLAWLTARGVVHDPVAHTLTAASILA